MGDPVSLGIFSSWGVVNVPTFNYTLVIVFLFPLHVGVTPFRLYSFCSSLQVYTYNTVVSSWYRLQIPCLHHAGVSSMSAHIQFNLWSVYYVFIWWDLMPTSSWEKLHPVPTAMLIVSNWYLSGHIQRHTVSIGNRFPWIYINCFQSPWFHGTATLMDLSKGFYAIRIFKTHFLWESGNLQKWKF